MFTKKLKNLPSTPKPKQRQTKKYWIRSSIKWKFMIRIWPKRKWILPKWNYYQPGKHQQPISLIGPKSRKRKKIIGRAKNNQTEFGKNSNNKEAINGNHHIATTRKKQYNKQQWKRWKRLMRERTIKNRTNQKNLTLKRDELPKLSSLKFKVKLKNHKNKM